ncbi:hypothetical protein PAHAL_1G388700 [Panicum hallii]|uniref:Uncharacterized protein n=1 Tax=Panicum hallii TaxID=206008 RepID=A0A2T8KXM8_9POAL|nr:hypothetical protein PAHAL_1G388700 [Panicum hallii]
MGPEARDQSAPSVPNRAAAHVGALVDGFRTPPFIRRRRSAFAFGCPAAAHLPTTRVFAPSEISTYLPRPRGGVGGGGLRRSPCGRAPPPAATGRSRVALHAAPPAAAVVVGYGRWVGGRRGGLG